MKSGYSIQWTNRDISDLNSIIKYLETNWSLIEIQAFAKKLDKSILTIKSNPFAFPSVKIGHCFRRCVLSPQTTIYYEIKLETITILILSDNPRDPNSFNLIE